MSAAVIIAEARRRSGLTLRQLAARAETSHSTISAYESGRVQPSLATMHRVVNAAGYDVVSVLHGRVRGDAPSERGDELRAVLELAEMFPARHEPTLTCPPFGRRP